MYKVTHAFDYSIIYFQGSEEACAKFIGQHIFSLNYLALIPA